MIKKYEKFETLFVIKKINQLIINLATKKFNKCIDQIPNLIRQFDSNFFP